MSFGPADGSSLFVVSASSSGSRRLAVVDDPGVPWRQLPRPPSNTATVAFPTSLDRRRVRRPQGNDDGVGVGLGVLPLGEGPSRARSDRVRFVAVTRFVVLDGSPMRSPCRVPTSAKLFQPLSISNRPGSEPKSPRLISPVVRTAGVSKWAVRSLTLRDGLRPSRPAPDALKGYWRPNGPNRRDGAGRIAPVVAHGRGLRWRRSAQSDWSPGPSRGCGGGPAIRGLVGRARSRRMRPPRAPSTCDLTRCRLRHISYRWCLAWGGHREPWGADRKRNDEHR